MSGVVALVVGVGIVEVVPAWSCSGFSFSSAFVFALSGGDPGEFGRTIAASGAFVPVGVPLRDPGELSFTGRARRSWVRRVRVGERPQWVFLSIKTGTIS